MATTIKKRGIPSKADAVKVKSYDKLSKTSTRIPSKRVYICSPMKGETEKNMTRARLYCRFAYDKGFVPVCPHIYFPQFLDDGNKDERAAGIRYGLEQMWQCRELWVFGASISTGMAAEIELAKDLEIPVKYFDGYMVEA